MNYNVSQKGADFVKQFEGYSAVAYKCPAGVWTIGYGTTVVDGKKVKPGMVCTKEQANVWLMKDIDGYLDSLNIKVDNLNQNQVDALASFAYNLGVGNTNKSTLLKKINAGNFIGAADEFLKWNKAGGKVLAGLVRRRKEERAMFLSKG